MPVLETCFDKVKRICNEMKALDEQACRLFICLLAEDAGQMP